MGRRRCRWGAAEAGLFLSIVSARSVWRAGSRCGEAATVPCRILIEGLALEAKCTHHEEGMRRENWWGFEARSMRASLADAGIQLLPQGSSLATGEIRFC